MNEKQTDDKCKTPEPDLGPGKDGYYETSIDRFTSWVQYEDAKAGAVLVLLGLGLTDVLGNADTLINAYHAPAPHHSGWGWVATVAFWAAIVAAVCTVAVIATAVWPYTGPGRRPRVGNSLFYFNDVATNYRYRDPTEKAKMLAEYRERVRDTPDEELEKDMSQQAFILAHIAAKKVRLVKLGFWSVTGFLIAWAVARIALGVA